MVVYKASIDEKALQLANDTDYGLGARWSPLIRGQARKITQPMDVGMADVNGVGEMRTYSSAM